MMRIGELAEQVGVNPKTIRYYESIGLLPEPPRSEVGYRLYRAEDADRLAFVRRAQQLGLTLDEIAEILALRERGQRPCGYVVSIARQRLGELDQRLEEMRCARNELAGLLERADELPANDDHYCALIQHPVGS